ncbi:MAG: ATP-binding protein [Candidatus Omnitrophota bacterium]
MKTGFFISKKLRLNIVLIAIVIQMLMLGQVVWAEDNLSPQLNIFIPQFQSAFQQFDVQKITIEQSDWIDVFEKIVTNADLYKVAQEARITARRFKRVAARNLSVEEIEQRFSELVEKGYLIPDLKNKGAKGGTRYSFTDFGEYAAAIFNRKEMGFSTVERIHVEFGMVFHQLGDLLHQENNLDVVKSDDLEEIERIISICRDLFTKLSRIKDMLAHNHVTDPRGVMVLLSSVYEVNTSYEWLKKIAERPGADKFLKRAAQGALDFIDFMIKRLNVVIEGIKQERFDLAEVVQAQVLYKGKIEPLEYFGYRDGFEFVVKNLQRNLLAHAMNGQNKMFDCTVEAKKTKDNIIFEFTDNGKGFLITDLIKQAKVLGMWTEAHENADNQEAAVIDLIFSEGFSTRAGNGTAHGLGLSLCRRIIERYFGGTLSAENCRDIQGEITGAKFIIILPCNPRIIQTNIVPVLTQEKVIFPINVTGAQLVQQAI